MMKKFVMACMVLLLTACTTGKKEPVSSASPEVSLSPMPSEVTVEKIYEYPVEPSDMWGFESDAGASYISDGYRKTIKFPGNENGENHTTLRKDAIFLGKDSCYTFSFDVSSSLSKTIEVSLLDGEGHLMDQRSFAVDSETQTIEYTFEMERYDDWNCQIVFELGKDGSLEHNILLDNFMITPLDDVKYGVRVDQLGYLVGYHKMVTFSYNQGNYFNVYDAESDEIVYQGVIGNGIENKETGEYNFQGDFSSFDREGSYYIQSETGARSPIFAIGHGIYDDALNDALKFMFLQRCGIEIPEELSPEFHHGACHTEEAIIYGFDQKKNVTGGWHDAGDYGRYTQTSIKALADLLLAYSMNAEHFKDDVGILESGNSIPDILDEARYELEWLLKLQKDDGSVYNKVTTESFAKNVLPDEDNEPLYILQGWTLSTAGFAGVMALSSEIFEEIDRDFAKTCYDAAIKAGNHLKAVSEPHIINNPGSFATGQYLDGDENDERFFAYAALWSVSGEEAYLSRVKDLFYGGKMNGTMSADLENYGIYCLLKEGGDDIFFEDVRNKLLNDADRSYNRLLDKSYPYPLESYFWGSNQHLCDDINQLMMAYHFSGQERYKEAALTEVHYLFGQNALGMSFVTGYGSIYPREIHHRITMLRDNEIKGALVGGPDQIYSDGILGNYLSDDVANAKRYLDRADSYTTNEVAIYYNSALVWALSHFE